MLMPLTLSRVKPQDFFSGRGVDSCECVCVWVFVKRLLESNDIGLNKRSQAVTLQCPPFQNDSTDGHIRTIYSPIAFVWQNSLWSTLVKEKRNVLMKPELTLRHFQPIALVGTVMNPQDASDSPYQEVIWVLKSFTSSLTLSKWYHFLRVKQWITFRTSKLCWHYLWYGWLW